MRSGHRLEQDTIRARVVLIGPGIPLHFVEVRLVQVRFIDQGRFLATFRSVGQHIGVRPVFCDRAAYRQDLNGISVTKDGLVQRQRSSVTTDLDSLGLSHFLDVNRLLGCTFDGITIGLNRRELEGAAIALG